MKNFLFLIILASSLQSLATSLKDFTPYSFQVLFTNPVCETYKYPETTLSRSGQVLTQKPKNVYCKKADRKKYEAASLAADFKNHPEYEQMLQSPQFKIMQWIQDPQAKEIFLAYLTFSNRVVTDALCERVKKDGVRVTVVVDKGSVKRTGDELTAVEQLANCQAPDGSKPKLIVAGDQAGLGFHHNKLIFINPKSGAAASPVKIIFSSGNMTSGTSMSHENWNFITTNSKSYFSQMHFCIIGKLTSVADRASRETYVKGVAACRKELSHIPEESDIQSFFVPGEGELATEVIANQLAIADDLALTSHRFTYPELISLISERAKTAGKDFSLRMLFDDDMFLVGKKEIASGGVPNMPNEFFAVQKLINQVRKAGAKAQVKWFETSHAERLLFHNKILLFSNKGQPFSTFIGAGNFTASAFRVDSSGGTNFENFYLVSIPEVVSAYEAQFKKMYQEMASFEENLPQGNPQP